MDWSVDDVSGLISEDSGFKIVSYDTDRGISEESINGADIAVMIEYAKKPGISVAYIDGDTFNERAELEKPLAPTPTGPAGTVDDTDEFTREEHSFGGVLIFYTGTATEAELAEAFIQELKNHYNDWTRALRWE